jgi:hypothetical protein
MGAVFNILFDLVYKDKNGMINQVFLTTHSPFIAKRDQASRRGVWIENNKTVVKIPSEAEVTEFFEIP